MLPRHIIIGNDADGWDWLAVGGGSMTCREAAYSEEVLEYMINNYRGGDYIKSRYDPVCYLPFDLVQGVVYKEVGQVTSEKIEQHGFSSIPGLYGLMSEEALEASGVLRIRRQPYFDLYGQGILVGFVDTGERVIVLSWKNKRKKEDSCEEKMV